MANDGKNEHDIVETVYTVGPGLRMAIIFVSFIFTLFVGLYGGYFVCQNKVIGDDKANQVEVLKSDTKQGLALVKDYLVAEDKIRVSREGRKYEECGDKLISDIIAK